MRKIPIIFLLVIHMAGNTDLAQLSGLTRLVSHYHEHKKTNPALGFTAFLYMHYFGDDGTTKDDNTDRQLPFRSNDGHCYVNIINELPAPPVYETPSQILPVKNSYGSALPLFYANSFLSSLLRPPINFS